MPTPRKSLAEHELNGTRPHYDVGTKESHIPAGRPKCPRYLTGLGRKKFNSLVRELLARRVATPGDADLIALYSTLWSRWRIADEHVQLEGAVVTQQHISRDGTPYTRDRKNHWLEVAQATEKQMAVCLEKLGLSIATRDKAKPTKNPGPKEGELIPGTCGWLDAQDAAERKAVPFVINPADMTADDTEEPDGNPDTQTT